MVEGKQTGLILNHAYGLNDVFEIDAVHSTEKDAKPIRLMRIRNPWGNSEWLGPWSDNSPEAALYKPELLKYIDSLMPDE